MPEMNSPENSQMQEIEELERQLAEKKAAMSIENGISKIEKTVEISMENIPELQAPIAVPAPASIAQTGLGRSREEEVMQDAKSIAMMNETRKIETLVAIALEKGITHSIEVANSLQDPYILDTLHDKLVGELHDRLVRDKKLKEI